MIVVKFSGNPGTQYLFHLPNRSQTIFSQRGQTFTHRLPDHSEVYPIVVVAQRVAQAAHGIDWRMRRVCSHSLGANLDNRFGYLLETPLNRADGLWAANASNTSPAT